MTYQIASLLEKMTSTDSDIRYMALNDLQSLLNKVLEDPIQSKVVKACMLLLQDSNGQVQNLAVSVISKLVNYLTLVLVAELLDLFSKKEESLKEVTCMALKSIVVEINQSLEILRFLAPKLIDILSEIQMLDIVDIITLIFKFNIWTLDLQDHLLKTLLKLLESSRQAMRKRCIICIGGFTQICSEATLNSLISHLVEGLSTSNTSLVQTFIACLAGIDHSKLKNLDSILPRIFEYLSTDDDDLKESCLQALEKFSSTENIHITDQVVNVGIQYIGYDPNYAGDYEDEMELDDEEEEEEFSDNDDISWKVRKSAAKLLQAIFKWKHIQKNSIAPHLIKGFGDREETVRIEIMTTFISLLRAPDIVEYSKTQKRTKRNDGSPMSIDQGADFVPSLMKAILKQFNSKSDQTLLACFHVLKEVVLLACLEEEFAALMPVISSILTTQKDASLKLACLEFLSKFCQNSMNSKYVSLICPVLMVSCKDSFHRIATESFSIITSIVKFIRPDNEMASITPEIEEWILKLFEVVWECVQTEQELETRQQSLLTLGVILERVGEFIPSSYLDPLARFIAEKVKNETTRVTALQVVSKLVNGPMFEKLHISDLTPTIASYLLLTHQPTRIGAFECLDELVLKNVPKKEILDTTLQCLEVHDMQTIPRLFNLLESIIQSEECEVQNITSKVLKIIMDYPYAVSGGQGLDALLHLFKTLSQKEIYNVYDDAIVVLLDSQLQKESMIVASKCIGVFDGSLGLRDKISNQLFEQLKEGNPLAIYSIGEIGKRRQLNIANLDQELFDLFRSSKENVKNAAATCLGHLACGNLAHYLPLIVEKVKSDNEYLALLALKDAINCCSDSSKLQVYALELYSCLFEKTVTVSEEGTRNLICECIGNILIFKPDLLANLIGLLNHENARTRATVIGAIKFTVSRQASELDDLLTSHIVSIFRKMEDPELQVRKATVSMLNAILYSKPDLVKSCISTILPMLFAETKVKQELIEIIEMGPLKQPIDRGLDCRKVISFNQKTAYECCQTLVDNLFSQIQNTELVDVVIGGVNDPNTDIVVLCHQLIQKLTKLTNLQQKVVVLFDKVKTQAFQKAKESAVKQDIDKNNEIVQSARKTVEALSILGEPWSSLNQSITSEAFSK